MLIFVNEKTFTAVYDNSPIEKVQPNSTTNYRFVPESGWSFMTEGFGYGKTDGLGYNNAYFDNLKKPDVVFICFGLFDCRD